MKEQWRPVPRWEDYYEASDLGRIRSKDRLVSCVDRWGTARTQIYHGRILRPNINGRGYHSVQLIRQGLKVRSNVSRLVLLAHLGPCPDGMEACHNDSDTANNRLLNLRWDTPVGNAADKIPRGTSGIGEHNPNAKLTPHQVRAIRASAEPMDKLAAMYGISRAGIEHVRYHHTWGHVA